MNTKEIIKKPSSNTHIKPVLCSGLFIRKDITGKEVKVGDIVKVTRPTMEFENNDEEHVVLDKESWIGQVVLLKSRGILIKTKSSGYIKAPLTDKSRNIWKWELIESYT